MKSKYSKGFSKNNKPTVRYYIKRVFFRISIITFPIAALSVGYLFFFKKQWLELKFIENVSYYSKKIDFTIKEVSFNEYDKSYCIDIAESKYFDQYKGISAFLVPINTIKKDIEKIDCISSVDVRRVFPDKIKVSLKPKVPVVIWQNKSKFYFVDSNSNVIKIRTAENLEKFIIVTGDNAPKNVAALLQFISMEPDVYAKVVSASFIGNRRWDIKFDNGSEVMLPEIDPELSWHKFLNLCKSKEEFRDWKYKVIDLRVEHKIYAK